MTYQHTATDAFSARIPGRGQGTGPAPFMTARRALIQVGRMLARFNTALMENSGGAVRVRRAEALQAKSDSELKAMGLKRDEIVYEVFKDKYYF